MVSSDAFEWKIVWIFFPFERNSKFSFFLWYIQEVTIYDMCISRQEHSNKGWNCSQSLLASLFSLDKFVNDHLKKIKCNIFQTQLKIAVGRPQISLNFGVLQRKLLFQKPSVDFCWEKRIGYSSFWRPRFLSVLLLPLLDKPTLEDARTMRMSLENCPSPPCMPVMDKILQEKLKVGRINGAESQNTCKPYNKSLGCSL